MNSPLCTARQFLERRVKHHAASRRSVGSPLRSTFQLWATYLQQVAYHYYTSGMKTAVSIPNAVYTEAERLTRRMRKSRSQFYTDALTEYVARHAPEEVTEAMNNVCDEVDSQPDPAWTAATRRILEQSENPGSAKFCSECGTALARQSPVASSQLSVVTPQPSPVVSSQLSVPTTQSPTSKAQSEAEACFLKSLEVAREQQAKSWELRTATSLARLWQQQGKTAEAHQMLSDIYGWFTEGFDTKDLQEAKALIEELSH